MKTNVFRPSGVITYPRGISRISPGNYSTCPCHLQVVIEKKTRNKTSFPHKLSCTFWEHSLLHLWHWLTPSSIWESVTAFRVFCRCIFQVSPPKRFLCFTETDLVSIHVLSVLVNDWRFCQSFNFSVCCSLICSFIWFLLIAMDVFIIIYWINKFSLTWKEVWK